MSAPSLLWHYTIGQSFKIIVAERTIKPSAAYTVKKKWPAVWFSKNEIWECSATKGLLDPEGDWKALTLSELREVGGGLFRIGVAKETAPHNWDDFVRLSGMDHDVAAGLRRTAKERGASMKEWFASFDPIDQSKWLAADIWDNHKWVSVIQNPLKQNNRTFDVSW